MDVQGRPEMHALSIVALVSVSVSLLQRQQRVEAPSAECWIVELLCFALLWLWLWFALRLPGRSNFRPTQMLLVLLLLLLQPRR